MNQTFPSLHGNLEITLTVPLNGKKSFLFKIRTVGIYRAGAQHICMYPRLIDL